MFTASKRNKHSKSITQFEDEANSAIMAALSMYNLEQQSEILGLDGKTQPEQKKQQVKDEQEQVKGEQEVKKEDTEEEGANDLVSGIPHHVVRATQAHHTADVSAITLGDGLGFGLSPNPAPAAAAPAPTKGLSLCVHPRCVPSLPSYSRQRILGLSASNVPGSGG